MEIRINRWEDVDHLPSGLNDPKDEFQLLFRFLRFRKAVDLPFTVRKSERPDFILSETIGLEVTWAANQSWEEAQAYLGNTKKPEYGQVSRNWMQGIEKGGRRLGEYVKSRQSDTTMWHSTEQAAAKADEVKRAIREKTESMRKTDYQLLEENWLLIGDRCPFVFLDVYAFCESMNDFLSKYPVQHEAIYFVTELRNHSQKEIEDVLFQLSPGNRCQIAGHKAPIIMHCWRG
jgi:hypothetical protein